MNRPYVVRLFMLIGAGVVAGTTAFLQMPEAHALPPFSTTTVACNGAACGGSATEKYHYDITPGSSGCTSFDVGFHGNYSITNVVMPSGWSYSIVSGVSWKDNDPYTVHGSVSPGGGTCTYKMHWSGPSQTSLFVIAYDTTGQVTRPHDAHWLDSSGSRANWANAVGITTGPIHSPIPGAIPP